MNFLIRLVVSAVAVMITAWLLPGISVDGFFNAILVALVLAILNVFLKPLFVVLTIPITIFTFGLFLFVINALIILLAGWFVGGFQVDGFWWALIFSIILTIISGILGLREPQKNN